MAVNTDQIKSDIDSEIPSSPPGAVRGLGASRLRTALKYIIDWIAATLFNPRGTWQASTFYAANDLVTYQGSTFRRLTAGTSGSTFTDANWELIASRGWSPVYAAVVDGVRVVKMLVDWTGGVSIKPGITGAGGASLYLGPDGLTTVIASATDIRGPQGYQGWSPIYSAIVDGLRIVRQLVDWTGGAGTKPAITGAGGVPQYEGATGLTTVLANATDIRGATGYAGWSPVYASTPSGQNIVMKLVDYVGGAGTKPSVTGAGGVPLYVGSTGLVTDINLATNFNPTKRSVEAGNVSTAYTIDLSLTDDTVVNLTLTANTTLTLSNGTLGKTLRIYVTQGGAGNFTITFPGGVTFPGGAAVDWNLTAGTLTVIGIEARSSSTFIGYYAKH